MLEKYCDGGFLKNPVGELSESLLGDFQAIRFKFFLENALAGSLRNPPRGFVKKYLSKSFFEYLQVSEV